MHTSKIDISRVFLYHIKIDPLDNHLLGLHWDAVYVDTCLLFGSRQGSQVLPCISDAIHFALRQQGYACVNYIDDFISFGIPDVAEKSFQALYALLQCLGLTICDSKLVKPSTRAVCLGIQLDSFQGTMAIPEDMSRQISNMVADWAGRKCCTKKQLQSLLGQLLYVHKCVNPARAFLNRMLEVVCHYEL